MQFLFSISIVCRHRYQLGDCNSNTLCEQEEFEDTNRAIRNRMSSKNRQHNGQKKKYKLTNKL